MGIGRLVIGVTSLVNIPIIEAIQTAKIPFFSVFVGYGIIALLSVALPILSIKSVYSQIKAK